MEAKLKHLKVTPRCLPLAESQGGTPGLAAGDGAGKCLFSGAATDRRAVFARAY